MDVLLQPEVPEHVCCRGWRSYCSSGRDLEAGSGGGGVLLKMP